MSDEATVKVRVDGGSATVGLLDQIMREQGVQVTGRTAGTDKVYHLFMADLEAAAAVADLGVLTVHGARPAIKTALKLFRKRFPQATVEVEVDGEPDDGGFVG